MLAQIISLGIRRISNLLGCLSGDFLLNKLVRVVMEKHSVKYTFKDDFL